VLKKLTVWQDILLCLKEEMSMGKWKKGCAWALVLSMVFPMGAVRAEELQPESETGSLVEPALSEPSDEENPDEKDLNECQHTWGFDESKGNYDAQLHYLVCTSCGEQKEEAHNFTGEFFGLKVCEAGCMVDPAQIETPGEENPDEETPGEEPDECQHTWVFDEEAEAGYDAEFHYLACTSCGEKKKEVHNFTSEFMGFKVCEIGCIVDPAQIETPGEENPGEETPDECQHTWVFDEEAETGYDLEFHYLACTSCGEKKKEAHTLTGTQFLGLEVCIQGCLLDFGGGEDKEPVEEDSFPLETYYSQKGAHAVKSMEVPCEEKGYDQYKIWYPADLESSDRSYPVIVVCNGTGSGYMEGMTDAEGYVAHFEQIASWGFIVVANNESDSFSGESAVKGANLLLGWNDEEGNVFHRKVDTQKIGVTGHSQGGAGCLNAATRHGGETIFKSVYSVSGTQLDLSVGLWGEGAAYDIGAIRVPCCFAAGIGAFEDIVIPLSGLQANYDAVQEGVPAVMMRRKNSDHGEMVSKGDGYLIAWFLYTLCDDVNASKIFYGEGAEILVNTNWQDVAVKSLKEVSGETPDIPDIKPEEPDIVPEEPGQQKPDIQPERPMQTESMQNVSEAEKEAAAFEARVKAALLQAGKGEAKGLKSCIDAEFYSALYPDLQEAFHGNEALLKEHFLTYGLAEGRTAIPFLDIVGYREKYPDLQKAFGDDWNAYLKHYFVYGIKEGRSSCTYFDAAAYVERYPDLKRAFGYDTIALFNHYITYGIKEGRNPRK